MVCEKDCESESLQLHHHRFDGEKWCGVMGEVGASALDRFNLLEGGFGSAGVCGLGEIGEEILIDEVIGGVGLNEENVAIDSHHVEQDAIEVIADHAGATRFLFFL